MAAPTTTPTAVAVPSKEPQDLLFNAELLDILVTGSQDTATDRLGRPRLTWTGVTTRTTGLVPIPYAAGIVFSATDADRIKTIERSGIVYVPLPSALPFTTSGTWTGSDDAKFRVTQGVTSDQLALPGAAAGIGFTQGGTAVATTVEAKLKESVTFDDFLTPTERAAAISGAVVDMTTNMNKALAAAKQVRAVAGRMYRFTTLEVNNDKTTIVIESGATLAPSNAAVSAIEVDGADCSVVGEGLIVSPAVWNGANARTSYATIYVTKNGFKLSGPTLYNIPRRGVHLEDATNCRVENTRMIGNYPYASYTGSTTGHAGIFYNPPTTSGTTTESGNGSLVVIGNRIESCVQGVLMGNFDSPASEVGVTIAGNNFALCWDHAVYLQLGKGNTITGNTCVNCKAPIVTDGQSAVVVGNTLYATETSQSNGNQLLSVRDAVDAVIANNTLYGVGAGIALDCISGTTIQRVKVSGNTIRRTAAGLLGPGIRVGFDSEVCEDVDIIGNTIGGAGFGISGVVQFEMKSGFKGKRNRAALNKIVFQEVMTNYGVGVFGVDHDDLAIVDNDLHFAPTAAAAQLLFQIWTSACARPKIKDNRLYFETGGANITIRGIQTDAAGKVTDNKFRNTAGSLVAVDNLGFVNPNSFRGGNEVSEGASQGRAVLVGGTVTVNTAEVLAGDSIVLSRVVTGGTTGQLSVGTITAGTSFVINSTSGTDTSTVYWEIRH